MVHINRNLFGWTPPTIRGERRTFVKSRMASLSTIGGAPSGVHSPGAESASWVRALETCATVLPLELVVLIVRPFPVAELARLACVHKKYKLAWDALRADALHTRVFSPYIAPSIYEPPTAAALEWVKRVKRGSRRAAALGNLGCVEKARVPPTQLVHYCVITDQRVVFENLVTKMFDAAKGPKDKVDLLVYLVRLAAHRGANECLAWLVDTHWYEPDAHTFALVIEEVIGDDGPDRHALPEHPCLYSPIRHEVCMSTNTRAIEILYRRFNTDDLAFEDYMWGDEMPNAEVWTNDRQHTMLAIATRAPRHASRRCVVCGGGCLRALSLLTFSRST